MIVSLRGTNGSGKSTVVHTILKKYPHEVTSFDTSKKKPKPEGYRVRVLLPKLNKPLMIIGSYETACGGCDSIQPYDLIWPRVVEYAKQGHVLFEGAIVSSSYGNIGRASEVYKNDFVFAFMDTPTEVCIERVNARRREKGNEKELDPKNLISKMRNVERSIKKIREEYRRRVVMIDHTNAVSQILKLFKESEVEE